MSFFVNGNTETVEDERGNTVWILGRMGVGVEAKVSADFVALGGKAINAYQLALLRHNILRWSGPDFTDPETGKVILATPGNIDKLDMTNPDVKALITAVVLKINELNTVKTAEVELNEADPTPAAEPT